MRLTEDHFWIAGATAVLFMLGASKAVSHSWYDPWCCNDSDCRPVEPDEVRALTDGYHYREWVIPYPQARVSADTGYHACEYPKGTIRCFYAPPGGV